jgi:quercetin dioxygenase-like cupin family protein
MTSQATLGVATQVRAMQPGAGRVGVLAPGVGVIFKIEGADTGGALSIVEHTFAPGALVPPHLHHLEDEYSIVLDGAVGFRSEEQEVVLEAGGYIIKPRGQVHAMWNAGSTQARMIEIVAPAGFERFFHEFADMTDAGQPDFADIAALAARYHLPFRRPDWLPDVIARYNLIPPPG